MPIPHGDITTSQIWTQPKTVEEVVEDSTIEEETEEIIEVEDNDGK